MNQRSSGLLLHITSLPSVFGIGDLGPEARGFADFLQQARQGIWQILPLSPTHPDYDHSPYHSSSAFAFNPLLISPSDLARDGWVDETVVHLHRAFSTQGIDYPEVVAYKKKLFGKAYCRFKSLGENREYENFCATHAYWLEDYALFVALQSRFPGRCWNEWPAELRDRKPETMAHARIVLRDQVGMEKFLQFIFFRQWMGLKNYCNTKGIRIFGDIPIYVTYNSADVWSHPELFKLDTGKRPSFVAGVPPDYFSETGQLWGNPIYDWESLKQRNFDWWLRRLQHNLDCFDIVRIDHFRGLVAYWEVPVHEETAINGRWVPAPAREFLSAVMNHFPGRNIVAEDLGHITDDVREVLQAFDLPGMKLLVFAFGGDLSTNPYAPHNHVKHGVVYTGTHDCNPIRAWFEQELPQEDKWRLFEYLGREVSAEEIAGEMVRMAMQSVADTAILPVQDFLGLGAEARMNRPGTSTGNWRWRLSKKQLTPELIRGLRELTETHGRC